MTNVKLQNLVSFENPPIVEVVCGISFNSLKEFLAPHYGILWQKFRQDYPYCEEQPLLDVWLRDGAEINVELTEIPPLPRIWFLSEQKDKIIQIQRNRFLYNWRKTNPRDDYPRFTSVMSIFSKILNDLNNFLEEENIGKIEPLQYEITYVNVISTDTNFSINDIGRVFPDFLWRKSQERLLSTPKNMNWNGSFSLPSDVGTAVINLKTLSNENGDNLKFLMDITVRSNSLTHNSLIGYQEWFNNAHRWIVNCFIDITSEEFQTQVWRRQYDN